jgi:acetoin utilization deacetylase AcuC-like enzyme/GNAT superfamily N-acetyltransferase
MFSIRRVYDDVIPLNREVIARVQEILRAQFPGLLEREILQLPDKLRNPVKYRLRSVLFVAEDQRDHLRGFALLQHAPDLRFAYLDYIATAVKKSGGGIGGALYDRVREEARAFDIVGLFFECLPDDPALCRDPHILKQNIARLRFYERYGARPITGTAYETPVKPGGDNPPFLVYDDLGRNVPLSLPVARPIVRAILERKYQHVCPPEYIDRVEASFRDDPVRLRPPRYFPVPPARLVTVSIPVDRRILLLVNDQHAIHHIRERGYVESPVRIRSIRRELDRTDLFLPSPTRRFLERHITAVHDSRYVDYFKRVCASLEPGRSVYPYVFPIRNVAKSPRDLPLRAGYYCIDTFTPLNRNAFPAARAAVDCALTGAESLLGGGRLAYALVRPPGHHAEYRSFGGFCYFNSSSIAAHFLSAHGRVAILDVDYHHGNGHQNIFYSRSDVLVISIHGHPSFAYPYFSGFEEERGENSGEGYNVNLPQPEHLDGSGYRNALQKAIQRIRHFRPAFLVVSLGLDTAKGDPTGSWDLHAADFEQNGRLIGALALPTLVVQEGGYDNRVLGVNARNFFTGLWHGAFQLE